MDDCCKVNCLFGTLFGVALGAVGVWEVTGQIVIENTKSGLVRAVRVRWRGSVARECVGCVAGCDLRVPA